MTALNRQNQSSGTFGITVLGFLGTIWALWFLQFGILNWALGQSAFKGNANLKISELAIKKKMVKVVVA